ncbi:MAG: PQQ-dependent sugar dehydrogenase [Planctomycetota bacterium]
MRPALLTLPLALALAPSLQSQVLPDGFEAVVVEPYNNPAGFVFTPQGWILTIQVSGKVRAHDGQSAQDALFLDLSDEVNDFGDRGLLGIALHPGYVPDGGPTSWVYLLYTVSPVPGQDLDFDEDDKYSFSRLTRYRSTTTGGLLLGMQGTREVLLGNQLADGSVPDAIASLHTSHSNGSLVFGADGSLLVAVGDGAHFDTVDTGGIDVPGFDDWTHPETGLRGPTPVVQDSGAFRAQDLRSLAGKILRIDPETGEGYSSNPFYDGDPTSNASRVWALGLRNPFRAAVLPGTGLADPALGRPGVLSIGDVGWATWEENNLCHGGENFGWPCFEGSFEVPGYQAFDPPEPAFPNCNGEPVGTLTGPTVAWHHSATALYEPPATYVEEDGTPLLGFLGVCSIAGALYDGGGYPDEYDGRLFFADFGFGWLKTLELNQDFEVVAIRPFGEGFFVTVDMQRHPQTGDLFVLDVQNGLRQLRYTDPDGVQPYGCGVNPAGSLALADAGVHIGEVATLVLDNPLGTQSPGSGTALGMSAAADPAFPCGTLLPGYGMTGAGAQGELLLSLATGAVLAAVPGPPWPGAPVELEVEVPYLVTLAGATVHLQGLILDPSFGGGSGAGIGLTDALRVVIGS